MSAALKPKLTSAGLAAVFNAQANGVEARISHLAFGDGGGNGYLPTGNETGLANEITRLPVGGGERVGPQQIQVQALLNDPQIPDFWIHELGIFLEDGTLLAIWSKPDTPLAYKTALTNLAVAFDLYISDVPADSLNVTVSGPGVNILFAREAVSFADAIMSLQLESVKTKRSIWQAPF